MADKQTENKTNEIKNNDEIKRKKHSREKGEKVSKKRWFMQKKMHLPIVRSNE